MSFEDTLNSQSPPTGRHANRGGVNDRDELADCAYCSSSVCLAANRISAVPYHRPSRSACHFCSPLLTKRSMLRNARDRICDNAGPSGPTTFRNQRVKPASRTSQSIRQSVQNGQFLCRLRWKWFNLFHIGKFHCNESCPSISFAPSTRAG
jgi:hypothetical protein